MDKSIGKGYKTDKIWENVEERIKKHGKGLWNG
jgi:hypothetical protein